MIQNLEKKLTAMIYSTEKRLINDIINRGTSDKSVSSRVCPYIFLNKFTLKGNCREMESIATQQQI